LGTDTIFEDKVCRRAKWSSGRTGFKSARTDLWKLAWKEMSKEEKLVRHEKEPREERNKE
jgi:hypothetical protein